MLNNNSSWQGFLLSSSMGAFPLLAWLRSGSSQGWWKINMLVDSEDITDGITYIRYIVPWQMKAGGQEPVMGHMTHNQMSGWSRWWARYFYQAVRMVDIVGNVIRGVSEKTIVCLPLFTYIYRIFPRKVRIFHLWSIREIWFQGLTNTPWELWNPSTGHLTEVR